MDKLVLHLNNENIHILTQIIEWSNKTFRKNYVEIKEVFNGRTLVTLTGFDEDYSALFRIGSNFGRLICKEKLAPERIIENDRDIRHTIRFKIISEDDKLILRIIDDYNLSYQTQFIVEEFEYDEVIFAQILATAVAMPDIFFLGYNFGKQAQLMRERDEIDW